MQQTMRSGWKGYCKRTCFYWCVRLLFFVVQHTAQWEYWRSRKNHGINEVKLGQLKGGISYIAAFCNKILQRCAEISNGKLHFRSSKQLYALWRECNGKSKSFECDLTADTLGKPNQLKFAQVHKHISTSWRSENKNAQG